MDSQDEELLTSDIETDDSNTSEQQRGSEKIKIDVDTVSRLKSLEENTITEYGRVVSVILVDYDSDTTASTTKNKLLSKISVKLQISKSTVESRLLRNSENIISSTYFGKNIFFFIELPGGEIFVDRISVPKNQTSEDPVNERYSQLESRYGGLEVLSQLEGEYIPITYDPNSENWHLDLFSNRLNGLKASAKRSYLGSVNRIILLFLFSVGIASTVLTPRSPTLGAISPQSLLIGTLVLLGIVFIFDMVRSKNLAELIRGHE